MIRILHIVSSLGTGSGVMSVLMSYHRHINLERVQFDYLSFRETTDTYEDEIRALGGRIYHCSRPSVSLAFQHEIDAFFAEHAGEYEIIHCHPIFASAVFAQTAKKYGVKRVIQHSHTTALGGTRHSAIRNAIILAICGRNATDFVACSEAAKKVFFWKKKKNVFLLPNAIDLEKFRFSPQKRKEIRMELGIDEACTVLGHVGRFAPEKNHAFLLSIFVEYCKKYPNSRLLLVGDGPLQERVRDQVETLGLGDSVIFAGRHSNVADYLSVMDVLVFPSKFEGLGIVLLEAQASGLPCFASDCVPTESNVFGGVSYISLDEDAAAWAQQIWESDCGRRDICNELASGYDICRTTLKLEKYYYDLVDKRRI